MRTVASTPSIAVIGAGITGLAAAHRLTDPAAEPVEVVVYERDARAGGRLRATPFAGVDHVDEGADSFLARVPDAVRLAEAVGLGDDLVHPEPVTAAVWVDGLHPIPDGLLLGVPRELLPLARTGLLTWRGKARAALEPLLPRSDTSHDSIGTLIRARFGNEVHDRIVDALVGSIYAADTDRSSLAEVPQLAALASSRSLLIAARRQAAAAGTATAKSAPIFATPRAGVGALAEATTAAIAERGAHLAVDSHVTSIARSGSRWVVDGGAYDAIILTTSAAAASILLHDVAPSSAVRLRAAESADVAMLTLHVSDDQWPAHLVGRSGYLVPKSVQRWVTAASFGSQKWAHWAPPAGGQIVRVSLGRDGLPVLHLDDDRLLQHTLDDLEVHLGVRFDPLEVRVSRWKGAFAQYRPHHAEWVRDVTDGLPPGIFLAGSAYRGIGIPACIRDGHAAADSARNIATGEQDHNA